MGSGSVNGKCCWCENNLRNEDKGLESYYESLEGHRTCSSICQYKVSNTVGKNSFVCRCGAQSNKENNPLLQKGSAHYKGGKIEPIEFILANDLDFCRGNVIKYTTRSKTSNNPLEDLDKAKHYIEFLQAQIRGEM